MPDNYTKNCKYCGQRIRMARIDNRHWLPFEIDGSEKHQCCCVSNSKSYCQSNVEEKHGDLESLFKGIFRIIIVMILMTIIMKFLFTVLRASVYH